VLPDFAATTPANTHHGLLLVHNEDTIRPGAGFETHPHRDMEIVTWVLEGALVHQDSTGDFGVIYPGLAQRMSAGTGIMHSEKNDFRHLGGERHTDPVHLVQMWIVPDEAGVRPGYAPPASPRSARCNCPKHRSCICS
jgi:redox-sensitive bicupin YhaK (pirin superfamily)